MRDTSIRNINTKEKNMNHILMEEDDGKTELEYRAKIILLKMLDIVELMFFVYMWKENP